MIRPVRLRQFQLSSVRLKIVFGLLLILISALALHTTHHSQAASRTRTPEL